MKRRVDPEVYGGAVLLGLNGNVIKAHGSSRERAIHSAIRVAVEEVSHGLNRTIVERMRTANERIAAAPAVSP
jgi:glycerol-3-phosphate acyltransferase PlsX